MVSDLVSDTVAGLSSSPEWRLEVADENGRILHLFRLTAETFDPQGVSESCAAS